MKIAIFLAGLTAGIVTAAFAGAVLLFLNSTETVVRIHNGSSSPLENVEILLAERTIWTGDITPGSDIHAKGEPSGDGEVHVRFTRNGQPVTHAFGYVTNGLSGELHLVDIADSGEISQTTCPKPLGQFFMQTSE
jgi:hypothetical protein